MLEKKFSLIDIEWQVALTFHCLSGIMQNLPLAATLTYPRVNEIILPINEPTFRCYLYVVKHFVPQ